MRIYLTDWFRLILFCLIGGVAVGQTPPIARRDQPLRIVYPSGLPPYFFTDEKGEARGVAIDVWRLWSEKTNTPVTFIGVSWSKTLELMKSGEVDIHAGLDFTPERDRFMDFGDDVFYAHNFLYSKENIFGVKNVEDLGGFKVGVLMNSFQEKYLREHAKNAVIVPYQTMDAIIQAAQNNEIRVFFAGHHPILQKLKTLELLDQYRYYPSSPVFSSFNLAGIREGDTALKTLVNHGMGLITKAERDAIMHRWNVKLGIKSDDMLVIAVPSEYPPFSYFNSKTKASGMFVDIWRLWERKTGRPIDFLVTDWEDTLEIVQEGKADIHMGLNITDARKELFDFSDSFYWTGGALFQHKSAEPFNHVAELKGRTVAIIKHSFFETFFEENHPEVKRLLVRDSSDLVNTVDSGEADAFANEYATTQSLLLQNGRANDFRPIGDLLFTQQVHAAVSKGNDYLLDLINEGLESIAYEELLEIEKLYITDKNFRYYSSPDKLTNLSQEEREWLRQTPTIRVGVSRSPFPPFYLKNDGASFKGIIPDILELFAERFGLRYTVVEADSPEQLEAMLRAREIDLIPAFVQGADAATDLLTTQPYLEYPIVLVTNEKLSVVNSLDALGGETVATDRFSSVYDKIKRDHPHLRFSRYADPSEALRAVATGRADLYAANLAAVSYLQRHNTTPNLKVSGTLGFKEQFRFAVRDDWPILTDIMKRAIKTMSSADINVIKNRWLPLYVESPIDYQLLTRAIGITLLVILAILLWNRRLKREVSERKRVERDLILAKEEADAANRSKSIFLANMSHEIRTPMNAIRGFIQLALRDNALSDKQRDNLNIINRSSNHLLNLINDILDMSKIESGRYELNNGAFNPHLMLKNLESMFRMMVEEKGIALHFEKDPNLPQAVHGDEGKIRQVFVNLLSNAIKFTDKGLVSVRLQYQEGTSPRLIVEVEDTGVGIAAQEMDKLFHTFEQTTSGKNRQGGTGLGLALSRGLVKLMGGDIRIESQLGRGVKVRFQVPVEKTDAYHLNNWDRENTVTGIISPTPAPRILIAEDSAENRLLLLRLLEEAGFHITVAENGLEAVEKWRKWSPDLILMDMRMPELDGLEATRMIKNECLEAGVLIIALTANTFPEDRDAILAAGCDDFIAKPFDHNELFQKLAHHLDITYRYLENHQSDSPVKAPDKLKQDLHALSADLKNKFYNAIEVADIDQFKSLLADLEPLNPELAAYLGHMADTFQYEALLQLIQAQDNSAYPST